VTPGAEGPLVMTYRHAGAWKGSLGYSPLG